MWGWVRSQARACVCPCGGLGRCVCVVGVGVRLAKKDEEVLMRAAMMAEAWFASLATTIFFLMSNVVDSIHHSYATVVFGRSVYWVSFFLRRNDLIHTTSMCDAAIVDRVDRPWDKTRRRDRSRRAAWWSRGQ